ncbi:sigma-70 family RNA polymerase sigma factor [Dyadobacter crusticola]|uniref:sigma-70 family RNA polymerase sigma factor n=1 Tax=Dyadobacter crusticola TaxID=292407 RepID=UPI0004E131DC|nr:sigma-70 family RNA polymerase sigma factor [Dyadobacter crusticola]
MNELERISNAAGPQPVSKPERNLSSLEVYDQFGAMAYGIVLQIIPQPHLAQEVLVSVFSSPLLQSCNSYPFSYAACIIKLARAKAVEAKKKLTSLTALEEDNAPFSGTPTPQVIFDLAFRRGLTPDEVAVKLNITKSEVLRSFHDFFKTNGKA